MKLFELYAELGLNSASFNKGIEAAGKQGKGLASSLSNGFSTISAKTVAAGHALYDFSKEAVRMATNFAKSVVSEYADAEQLIGGVETLFAGNANTVIKNAQQAYKTAGMSANQYMETVTSFSTSLLQGLEGNTAAAAKAADMAVQDMSDNANKMGTDMALIQNAYQGFAKDNFTMLDNLKLGYGGTAAEMARLINDSGVLGKTIVTASTVSEVPLDKMFEAIHKVQTEMGITGTTAKEAAQTISGSFNAFKASWSNLLSGMGTDQDMNVLIDNLFETGEHLISNLMMLVPKIGSRALQAVDAALERFDLYRTLKNAYRVGEWQGLGDAAIESFKRGVKGFGEWAVEVGSKFLASVLSGLTGNEQSAEKIKTILTDIFDAAGDVLSSLGSTFKDTLKWIGENWTKLAPIIGAMGTAFAILAIKANPLEATMTALSGAIVLLTTDWDKFEQNNPRVVKMFEDLTNLDFDDFKNGVESTKTALNDIVTWFTQNEDIVKEMLALVGGLAIYAGHPVIGAGLIGAAFGIETDKEYIPGVIHTDTKDITPAFTEVGQVEYTREQLKNALDTLRNAAPNETPAIITGPDGETLTKMKPTGSSTGESVSGTIDALTAAVTAFQSAAATIPQEAASAAAGAISGAKVEIDGATAGEILLPHISAGMARQRRIASRANG